jgi:DNA-binding FadR family transcriptional regulator
MPSSRTDSRGYPSGGLHGQIVHTLGRQIVGGAIAPGELLPQQVGSGASRTVMREVIKVLVTKGLVESRPRTGTRVLPRDAWNLLDPDVLAWRGLATSPSEFLRKLTEVRLVVEPAAAELAAQRAGQAELEAIDTAFRGMERALEPDPEDFDAFNSYDMEFHRGIVRACGNDLLEQMGHVIHSALLLSFEATSRLPGRSRESLPHHRAILEAIRRRQVKRAGRAMRSLVESTAQAIAILAEE